MASPLRPETLRRHSGILGSTARLAGLDGANGSSTGTRSRTGSPQSAGGRPPSCKLGAPAREGRAYSSSMSGSIVGRDAELLGVERFLTDASRGATALVIQGEPGIGKTTLWREALRRAGDRGMRVLSSRPGSAETRLTFVGLGDLLGTIGDDVLAELPTPQRRALDVALLRSDPGTSPPEQRAVSAAFLSVLGVLSADTPVLLAVDDLQWLDASSRRVLEFALRRLGPEPVGFLGTVRLDGSPAHALVDESAHRIRLQPFNLASLHEILKSELGRTFARPTLVRIERVSLGNPFFALELARALVELDEPPHGSAPLPIPSDLTRLIAARLRRLPAGSRRTLLVAAALPQPTVELLDRDALVSAEAADVVRVDEDGRVFFTHPLLAATVYGSAPAGRRREVHRLLADRASDAEARARHLALAAEEPDEAVAAALTDAAGAARARGAPDAAIELLELACEQTPRGDPDALYARRLELGALLSEAGDPERAANVLRDVAEHASAGGERARALLLLAYRSETSQAGEAGDLCDRALEAAGDDSRLRVEILAAASRMADEDIARKSALARRAREIAQREDVGPELESYALLALAEADFFAGRGIAAKAFRRAAEREDAAAAGVAPAERSLHRIHHHGIVRPSARLLGILRIYADELDEAREEFALERTVALEHGDDVQLARTLLRLAEIETRAGTWELAERHLDEAAHILERARQQWLRCWLLAVKTTLDTLRGRVEEARGAGAEGLELAAAIESIWFVADCHAALGFADLSCGKLSAARDHLESAAELESRIGAGEPRLIRYRGDWIETLVGLGELDRASEALASLESSPSPWASAVGGRCRGLLHSARGELDDARHALEQAVAHHEKLPIPFELARTLLVTGQVHRRRKERRLAKEQLGKSIEIFQELGAPLWLEHAQSELRRLGLRRGAGDELTPTEEKVASLAASGLTNREIAERIFVSPKTVEANLSRTYRKLGIHSRAELGAHMARRERLAKT